MTIIKINRWINGHSLFMLLLICLYISGILGRWAVCLSTISVLGILVVGNIDGALYKRINYANLTTGIRLILLQLLFLCVNSFSIWVLIGGLVVVLFLDYLDGYFAKKFNQASIAGEYFDKEVDALFVMLLSIILYEMDKAGIWVLSLGLIRYVYVLVLPLVKSKQEKEYKFKFGTFIAGIIIFAMITCLALPFSWSCPILVGTLILMVYSFGRSFLFHIKT